MAHPSGHNSTLYPFAIFTGLTLAGAIYVLYQQQTHQKPSGSLHRSNAQRRVRGHNGRSNLSFASGNRVIAADGNETETEPEPEPEPLDPTSSSLKELVYFIAEQHDQSQFVFHHGIRCSSCRTSPIRGVRYKCLNCSNIEFCSVCHVTTSHPKTHVLCAIKIPAPSLLQWEPKPVIYPTEFPPHDFELSKEALQRLKEATNLDLQYIKSLFEEFKTLATQSNSRDLNSFSISPEVFEKAMYPQTQFSSSKHIRYHHQKVYDYWANDKGLIGFPEFLLIHGPPPSDDDKLGIIFTALMQHEQTVVSRQDFVHLFEAQYHDITSISHNHLITSLAKDEEILALYGRVDQPLSTNIQRWMGDLNLTDDAISRPEIPFKLEDKGENPRPIILQPEMTIPRKYRLNKGSPALDPSVKEWLQYRRKPWETTNENHYESAVGNKLNLYNPLLEVLRAAFNEILDAVFEKLEQTWIMIRESSQLRDTLRPHFQVYLSHFETGFFWEQEHRLSELVLSRKDRTLPHIRPNSDMDLQLEYRALAYLDAQSKYFEGVAVAGLRLEDFKHAVKSQGPDFLNLLWSFFKTSRGIDTLPKRATPLLLFENGMI